MPLQNLYKIKSILQGSWSPSFCESDGNLWKSVRDTRGLPFAVAALNEILSFIIGGLGLLVLLLVGGCDGVAASPTVPLPTAISTKQSEIKLIPFEATTQEISFLSFDGTRLAGQFDWPVSLAWPPLVFIIHHAGPEDRDTYQYLAARLVPAGYGVFRFDKRGTGQSGGAYGCCEADDALAAYQAAIEHGGFNPDRVFIVAQSIGTRILAEHFDEFERYHPPAGVILLSSLLKNEEVLPIEAPMHIIVSDSEPDVSALTEGAVKAHLAHYDHGASYYIAPRTEHTLFDISAGPIDWSDPSWVERFHTGAWLSMLSWLEAH